MSEVRTGPVIVGIDGSAVARNAVRWAAQEAQRRDARLRIVYGDVFALPALPDMPGLRWAKEQHVAVRRQVETWLSAAAETAAEHAPGVPVETASLPGTPEKVLIAESARAGLMVVGDRGFGGFTGLLAGSAAVAVVAHGRCPTVVVRGAEPTFAADGPVVVGVNGPPPPRGGAPGRGAVAQRVLAHGFDLADTRSAPLRVVHTWHAFEVPRPPGGLAAKQARERAELYVAELLAGWRERYPDVAIERFVGPGSPAVALLEQSERAQLLVVGSRGRGGFAGLLLGSTSQALIHHAGCPVLVVPTA